jgi:hypothetical protein
VPRKATKPKAPPAERQSNQPDHARFAPAGVLRPLAELLLSLAKREFESALRLSADRKT